MVVTLLALMTLRKISRSLRRPAISARRVNGLKHQKEKRSMDHFAGLDVSGRRPYARLVVNYFRLVMLRYELSPTCGLQNQ